MTCLTAHLAHEKSAFVREIGGGKKVEFQLRGGPETLAY